MGPDVYSLSGNGIVVNYYNGECCCIAKEVLKELQRRVDDGELDWMKMKDETFRDEYLRQVCRELKELK